MQDSPRMTTPLLRTVNLSKRYGGLSALQGVSFSLRPGEVLGIVGRPGAGKSTLLHLLAGVHLPTLGDIQIDGRTVHLGSPADAQRLGIELVHHKPTFAENLNVFQNIALGWEICWPPRIGVPDDFQMAQRATAVLADLDAPPNFLKEKIPNLSDEMRQVTAIARVFCKAARLVMFDDALSALGFQRQKKLLARVKTLAAQGVVFVIASDNLEHLFAITDRLLVLYEGRAIAHRRTADCTPREIVELIVGASHHEQVTPVIWALESYHAAQQQAEELRNTQATLRENLAAQDSLNRELVERQRDQLEALDRLNIALQDAHRRLLTEREQERKHIARELHDQVIQDLLSFNYRLEEAESHSPNTSQQDELAAIRKGIRQVVSELRQVCSDLRPPSIDAHGLASAISSYAQEWSEQSGVTVTLDIDPRLGRLPEPIELSIFRIVQEGLNNIRKHASAQRAWVTVQRAEAAALRVRIADDGRGTRAAPNLAALSARKHFGLLNISERVALLGGTMQFESPTNGGLVLQIEIPSPSPS